MGHYVVVTCMCIVQTFLEMTIDPYFYMLQDTCRDIFEDPVRHQNFKGTTHRGTSSANTPAAAMQRCYLDLSLFVSDEYMQGWMIHCPSV